MDAEDNDYEDDDEDIVNMMECVTWLKQYKGIDSDAKKIKKQYCVDAHHGMSGLKMIIVAAVGGRLMMIMMTLTMLTMDSSSPASSWWGGWRWIVPLLMCQ